MTDGVFDLSRRRFLTATGATASVAVAGCLTSDQDQDQTALTDRTLRLGSLKDLSGALAGPGQTIANAVDLAVAEFDGTDISVDMQRRDTESSPVTGIEVADELAAEGVPAIVGPMASGVALQVTQQVTIPEEILTCSPSATSPTMSVVNDRGFSYRTAPDDSLQAVVAARLAVEKHDAGSASVLHIGDDYGRQLAGAFAASFSGTIDRQVSFDPDADDFSAPLRRALASEPELLFLIGFPENGSTIFQEYYANHQGEEIVFVSDGLYNAAMHDEVGNPMSNVYGTAPMADGPGIETFNSAYENAYGRKPALFNAHAYDGTAVLLLANAAAGENDGNAIRAEIPTVTEAPGTEIQPGNLEEGLRAAAAGEQVHYRGASGEIEFDRNGDVDAVKYEYFTYGTDGISSLEQARPEVEG